MISTMTLPSCYDAYTPVSFRMWNTLAVMPFSPRRGYPAEYITLPAAGKYWPGRTTEVDGTWCQRRWGSSEPRDGPGPSVIQQDGVGDYLPSVSRHQAAAFCSVRSLAHLHWRTGWLRICTS